MKNKTLIIHLFIVLVALYIYTACQKDEVVDNSQDYLPLQVGNYWELNNGTYTYTLLIDKIENLDGLDYFRMIRTGQPENQDTVYFRRTQDRKIFQRGTKSTDEIVRFNLAADSGEVWNYAKDPTTTWNEEPWTAKLYSKSDTVIRSNVLIKNCYVFSFDIIGIADDPSWAYSLAPGIGFVKYYYCFYPIRRITKARINGVEREF